MTNLQILEYAFAEARRIEAAALKASVRDWNNEYFKQALKEARDRVDEIDRMITEVKAAEEKARG